MGAESVLHTLVECPESAAAWFACPLGIRTRGCENNDFASWFGSMCTRLDKGAVEMVGMIAWSLWKARNRWVMEEKKTPIKVIIESACKLYSEYQEATITTKVQVANASPNQWKVPPLGVIKINTDGAMSADKGGLGVVFRDSDGNATLTLSIGLEGSYQPDILELLAIRTAVQKAVELSIPHIMLESDCWMATSAIRRQNVEESMAGQITVDIKVLLSNFTEVSILHVKRNANKVTHALAKMGTSIVGESTWNRDSFPLVIS